MRFFLTIALIFFTACLFAQSFTPGNLVVLRYGDGVSTCITSKTVPLFLDEYTPSGVLVRSISMPTAVSGLNRRLTGVGSDNYEGSLYRSGDGRFLTLAGFDADINTEDVLNSSATAVNRVVGIVSSAGTVNTTTALSAPVGIPRAAVTADGSGIWVGGSVSTLYYAATGNGAAAVSLGLAPGYRSLTIFNNQLYATSAGATLFRIGKIGTGLPVAGTQTAASLPGIPLTIAPNQAVFFDTDDNQTPDLLYYADDAAGAIVKYRFSNNTWVHAGALAVPVLGSVKGITGSFSSGTVTLFAVTSGAAAPTAPSAIHKITDALSATLDNSTSLVQVVAAPAKTSFKGIAFSPSEQPLINHTAVQADEFVNSIGICTHPPSQQFNGVRTAYLDTVTFKARVAEIGIRHMRMNAYSKLSDWNFWKGLHTDYGVKITPIIFPAVWTSLTAAINTLKNYVSIVEAIEGPNETDNEGISYNG